MVFNVSAIATTLTTGIATGVGFSGVMDNRILDSADYTDQAATAGGLTARAVLLDGQSSTLGEVFVFTDVNDSGTNAYLFIQGGSAGTADDLIVNIGSGDAIHSGNEPTMTFTTGMISFG